MSAICGIVRFDGRQVEQSELETMVASSPCRGPDGTGYWIHQNAGFAHLAFHVTPESVHEKQPLVSVEGDVLLADVRLDNREELAGQLAINREQLPQLTDPDLLLRAWQAWGKDCVTHLHGDFVFAVWNPRAGELFLARDPLGTYGLSWQRSGDTLVFASEITAILDLPFVHPVINEDAVLKTLGGLRLAESETFFRDVHSLAPASCLLSSRDSSRSWTYWDVDPGQEIRYRSDEEYRDHFLELLQRAVANRCRSIGPVGLSLSGGHDSTLLAALAAKHLASSGQPPLKSFSYVFDHFAECDERQYIGPVVAQYGIDARYINADGLWTFSGLEQQAVRKDYLWTNCFSQLPEAIAAAAGQSGCRVLLDGMFGDALFCEPSGFAADLIRQGRLLTLLTLMRQYPEDMSWSRDVVQRGLRPLVPARLRRLYRRLRPGSVPRPLPGLSAARLERMRELAQAETRTRTPGGWEAANRLPGKASRYTRIFRNSWAQGFAATRAYPYNHHGVERVSPYFDQRVVEFVMAIPTERLSHRGFPRKLQKQAMAALLPEGVCRRRDKTWFTPLLLQGLGQTALLEQLASAPLIVSQDWVEQDWLKSRLPAAGTGQNDNSLSMYLHAELWLRAIATSRNGRARWADPFYHLPPVKVPGANTP